MPQIEMHMPKGAITPEAKAELMDKATKLLLKMEGAPETPESLSITWCYVNEYEPGNFTAGGKPPVKPRYRVVLTVPEGTTGFHGPSMLRMRSAMVEETTKLVLAAEGTEFSMEDASRVWVQIVEIRNGFWGGFGKIVDIMDIATFNGNERAKPPTEFGLECRKAIEAHVRSEQSA
ncbi:MAG: hypothetical protein AAF291_00370 [Pseudomonadota bacterium]